MRIECSNCGAAYEVAESAIPPEGREVQCAKCDHVWLQMPPAPEPEPEVPSAPLDLSTAADDTTEDDPQPEIALPADYETAELQSYRADSLPDAQERPDKDYAEILESEAEFARAQRTAETELTEEEPTQSPLETLRRRVIDDTHPVPEESFQESQEEAAVTEEIAEPPIQAGLADTTAEDVAATEEVATSEEHILASADEAPASEKANAFAKPAASGFRRMGAKTETTDAASTEPSSAIDVETQAPPKAPENPSETTAAPAEPGLNDPVEAEAAQTPAPKRRRQSLAELSSQGSVTPSAPENAPASRPFDLGPAAPEERPETPSMEEAPGKPVELLSSEPIAKPDMSPEAIARRAMEELDAVEVKEEKSRRSLAGGFAIGLLLIVVLMFLYSFGPLIGEAVPALAPAVNAYVAAVDSALTAIGIDFSAIGRTLAGWLEAIQ